jgi:hypothetical protein
MIENHFFYLKSTNYYLNYYFLYSSHLSLIFETTFHLVLLISSYFILK